jgi:hypothetical protein
MLSRMWSALQLSRPRWLRLPGRSGGKADAHAREADARFAAAELEAMAIEDVSLVITKADLDRLGSALVALLGPDLHRPDTPARLEAALVAAVERLGGSGRPRVTRQPAGVTTPEVWQLRLSNIETEVGEAVRVATRTGRFPEAGPG